MRSKIRTVCWILLVVFHVVYVVAAVNWGKFSAVATGAALMSALCVAFLFFEWLFRDYFDCLICYMIEKTNTDHQTQIDDMERELEEMRQKLSEPQS